MNTRGDKIFQLLYAIDQEIIYSKARYKIADSQFRSLIKKGNKSAVSKAMYSKIERECFKNYCKEIEELKEEIVAEVKEVLYIYCPRYAKPWYDYFINRFSIKEIAQKYDISLLNAQKLINETRKNTKDILGEYYGTR